MTNYYDILGIESNATQEQIKKAFRINAVKYHPDKNSGDPEFAKKFIEVKEAYDILSDSIKKQEYDLKYQEVFGKQEQNNKEKEEERKQEKTKRKQKEDEQFRYDPYKPFYSSFDREEQETPQFEPKQTPWGFKMGEGFEYFKLPKRIGKLIGGFSTVAKGQKAKTEFQVFINALKGSVKIISIVFGLLLAIYLHWYFNLHQTSAVGISIFFFIVASIVVGIKYYLNSNDANFEHLNYFIGINGFAIFKCSGTKENIVQNNEINFNDVTDLITREIIKKVNFNYVNTEYQFIWMNTKSGKIVYHKNGTYSDEKNERTEINRFLYPEYTLNKEAEKYWTVYLLDKMESDLEKRGYLEFNLYSFENNTFTPYIRLGIGYITFLKGEENFTYKFNEIKKMYTKNADLFIEHHNFEKKLFFFKSGNQDSIPLRNVCNRQFFYKSIEILLGYKIN